MSNITTLVDTKLSMQLDSVCWNKKFDLLAIGAYMIDPSDSSKRIGKMFLLELCFQKDGDGNEDFSQELVQEVDLSGVLDLRWEPNEENKLAVATSNTFEMYELLRNPTQLKLESRLELDAMALYTQWLSLDKLIFSDSLGVISIVDAGINGKLEVTSSKKVHENLTWVVQCSTEKNLVFAGSDEGSFTGFLLENIEDEEKHFTKKFQVGVTSIIFLEDNILAVGSYDDTLRIFTIDSTDPISLSLKKKIEFGGAVWRTISFPAKTKTPTEDGDETLNYYIVAACARDGIHIISLNRSNWSYKTLTSCSKYEGFLAYGLDAKNTEDEHNVSFTIASCYFDNHHLHVWKTNFSAK